MCILIKRWPTGKEQSAFTVQKSGVETKMWGGGSGTDACWIPINTPNWDEQLQFEPWTKNTMRIRIPREFVTNTIKKIETPRDTIRWLSLMFVKRSDSVICLAIKPFCFAGVCSLRNLHISVKIVCKHNARDPLFQHLIEGSRKNSNSRLPYLRWTCKCKCADPFCVDEKMLKIVDFRQFCGKFFFSKYV